MAERGDIVIGEGKIKFGLEYRDLLSDQGVCIHALGEVGGEEVEVLRFDCFDHAPHYHYGPEKRNERLMLDQTTEGDPMDWTIRQLRTRLPEMLNRAGYDDLASDLDAGAVAQAIDDTEGEARRMAREGRSIVMHDRGDVVVEAGPIRFGIEFRELANDRGVTIHVLGDVGDEEVELLTFDCFEVAPHYHYGPRAKNQRLYLDTTAVPNPLDWALDLLRYGKLSSMLDRAGYADYAARLSPSTLGESVAEVARVAKEMERANAR